MAIKVRRTRERDLLTVIQLADQLYVSDFPHDTDVDLQWAHTPAGRKEFRDRVSGKEGICFVAEAEGKIVGYLMGYSEKPEYRTVLIAQLDNIFVLEEFRSAGVGKALVDAFKKWAHEIGANRIAVGVYARNEKALGFYQHLGFAPHGVVLEIRL